MTDAEARVRAAIDLAQPLAIADVGAILDELARVRAESAERWVAIGRLAPRAKQHRGRSEDLARVLGAVGDRLRAPIDDAARAALVTEIEAALIP